MTVDHGFCDDNAVGSKDDNNENYFWEVPTATTKWSETVAILCQYQFRSAQSVEE